jgi:hypothetical protein
LIALAGAAGHWPTSFLIGQLPRTAFTRICPRLDKPEGANFLDADLGAPHGTLAKKLRVWAAAETAKATVGARDFKEDTSHDWPQTVDPWHLLKYRR